MARIIPILLLSVFSALGCGDSTGSSGSQNTQTPVQKPSDQIKRVRLSNFEMTVAPAAREGSAAPAPDPRSPGAAEIPASVDVSVTGRFTVDDKNHVPRPVTIRFVSTNRDGSKVIANEETASTSKEDNDTIAFSTRLRAPRQTGAYELQALYQKEVVSEQKITVSGN